MWPCRARVPDGLSEESDDVAGVVLRDGVSALDLGSRLGEADEGLELSRRYGHRPEERDTSSGLPVFRSSGRWLSLEGGTWSSGLPVDTLVSGQDRRSVWLFR